MKIDYSTLRLPIEPGEWCDADERMFQACFTILGQFVEEELGQAKPGGPEHRGYRLHSVGGIEPKAIDLWIWYRDELPTLEAEYDQDLCECYSGDMKTELTAEGLRKIIDFGKVREPKFPHDYPELVKEEKLAELMAIRRGLWT